jgi:hypothetical protein
MTINKHIKLGSLSLILSLVGCGKKAIDEPISEEKVQYNNYLESGNIKVNTLYQPHAIHNESIYKLKSNAYVAIPSELQVLEGNAANGYAKIVYNESKENYDFYCLYQGGAQTDHPITEDELKSGQKYYFKQCYTANHQEISYQPPYMHPHDQGKNIKVQIISADKRSEALVQSLFEADRH